MDTLPRNAVEIIADKLVEPTDRANFASACQWLNHAVPMRLVAIKQNNSYQGVDHVAKRKQQLSAALRRGECERLHISHVDDLIEALTEHPGCGRRIATIRLYWPDTLEQLNDAWVQARLPALRRIEFLSNVDPIGPCFANVPWRYKHTFIAVPNDPRVWFIELRAHFDEEYPNAFPWRASCTDHLILTGCLLVVHIHGIFLARDAGFRADSVFVLLHSPAWGADALAEAVIDMTSNELWVDYSSYSAFARTLVRAFCARVTGLRPKTLRLFRCSLLSDVADAMSSQDPNGPSSTIDHLVIDYLRLDDPHNFHDFMRVARNVRRLDISSTSTCTSTCTCTSEALSDPKKNELELWGPCRLREFTMHGRIPEILRLLSVMTSHGDAASTLVQVTLHSSFGLELDAVTALSALASLLASLPALRHVELCSTTISDGDLIKFVDALCQSPSVVTVTTRMGTRMGTFFLANQRSAITNQTPN